jgi:hypothetical protein
VPSPPTWTVAGSTSAIDTRDTPVGIPIAVYRT